MSDKAFKSAAKLGSRIPKFTVGPVAGLTSLSFMTVAAIALAAATLTAAALMIRKMLKTYKTFLFSVDKKLSSVSNFDEDKFKSTEVKAFSKDNHDRGMKVIDMVVGSINSDALMKVASELEGVATSTSPSEDKLKSAASKVRAHLSKLAGNKDVANFIGLNIASESGVGSVAVKTPSVNLTKGDLGSLGWKASDAKNAVKDAIRLTASIEGVEKSIGNAIKANQGIINALKTAGKADKEIANSPEFKQAIRDLRSVIDMNKTIVKATISAAYRINKSATRIGRAALKAGGVKVEGGEE